MPGYNEQMTQALSIADVLNSQSVNNTSVSSAGVDMSKFHRVMYVIQAPSLGAAGTLDGRLQASAQSNFNVVTNITGTNLTQILTASTPGNNAVATIEVRSDEVANLSNSLKYVRLNLTGGGNAITVSAVGLGGISSQGPASQFDVGNTILSQRVVCSI